jgi:hypothetical protein
MKSDCSLKQGTVYLTMINGRKILGLILLSSTLVNGSKTA